MEKELISLEQIDYLADLSMLTFTEKERNTMVKEVSGILSMLQSCEDVQITEKSKPRTVSLGELREDKIEPSLNKDIVLGQALDVRNDYVSIPKVVD